MKIVLKALIILFIASPALAEDSASPYDPVKQILDSRNKKSKGMQSASWKTPEKEETAAEVEKETKDEDKGELWNKYKNAEENKKDKEHKTAEATDQKSEKAEADESENEKKTNPKPKTGLAGILEKYKNSQKNKGGMSSRSFGNLDR